MLWYASKCNNRLCQQDFYPEDITGRVMLNPIIPAYKIRKGVKVVVDSGGFQTTKKRLQLREAMYAQYVLMHKIRKYLDDPEWIYEAVSIYDQMLGVDEEMIEKEIYYPRLGVSKRELVKVKKRGTLETARPAIQATLEAAAFWDKHRHVLGSPVVFIGQGINPDQYMNECMIPMLDFVKDGDWLGLGGFCIIGKQPSLKPHFCATLRRVLPLAKKKGLKRVHIYGVAVRDMIAFASCEARKEGIIISTDHASPEINAARYGNRLIEGRWVNDPALNNAAAKFEAVQHNLREYQSWIASLN